MTNGSDHTPSTVAEIFTPPASVVSPNHASNGNTRAPTLEINSGFLGPTSDGHAYSTDVLAAAAPSRYGLPDMDTGAPQNLTDTPMDFSFMNVPDWQWLHQDLFFQTDPSSVIEFQSPEGLSNGATLPQQQPLQPNSTYGYTGVNGNPMMHSSDPRAFQTTSSSDTRSVADATASHSFCKIPQCRLVEVCTNGA